MMIATTMNAAISERARSSVFDRVVVTVSSRAISIYSMKARSFGGRRRVKFTNGLCGDPSIRHRQTTTPKQSQQGSIP
jgi:hypothetical protein